VTGGGEAVKPEQGSVVKGDMADLDHALQPYDLLFSRNGKLIGSSQYSK
jgi:hypothetical protein